MIVLVRAVTSLRFLLALCWFICPLDSCRGRALFSLRLPKRRISERSRRSSHKALAGRATRVAPDIERGNTARFPQS